MDFEPFGKKAVEDLVEDDLGALRSISEGWYIEYKRELPKADSIAKSISAIANTYGGWVFYGVEETKGGDEVASSFPGLPEEDLETGQSRIRDAVSGSISPSPHYDIKVIRSSGANLIPDGRVVIAVKVPRSWNTPHLHQSGRIFRRVGSSSAPVVETDRAQLDKLVGRRKELGKHYADIFGDRITVPKNQKKTPFLRLFLVADLWRDHDVWLDVGLPEVRAIMGDKTGEVAACPFDSVSPSFSGFTARQLVGNSPASLTTTWELRRDLVSDIVIPLIFRKVENRVVLRDYLHGYRFADRFVSALKFHQDEPVWVLDANFLFASICGIANIQMALMKAAGLTGTYWFKAEITNADGFTTFLDCENIIEHYESHTAPVCMRKHLSIPSGNGLRHFLETWEPNPESDLLTPVLRAAIPMFTNVVRALGIPDWIEAPDEGRDRHYTQLCDAAVRFQKIRSRGA